MHWVPYQLVLYNQSADLLYKLQIEVGLFISLAVICVYWTVFAGYFSTTIGLFLVEWPLISVILLDKKYQNQRECNTNSYCSAIYEFLLGNPICSREWESSPIHDVIMLTNWPIREQLFTNRGHLKSNMKVVRNIIINYYYYICIFSCVTFNLVLIQSVKLISE